MEEIKRKAQNLKNRVAGINNWIQGNPQVTDPNMYEYTQVLVEFGEILAQADEYYKKNGYPENIRINYPWKSLFKKTFKFIFPILITMLH